MIITLCGSARFEDAYHQWNERLTLNGHVVIGLAVYPSMKKGNKNWYTPTQKLTLDRVHLKKVAIADAILVVDQDYENADPGDSYIGESTQREIAYAFNVDTRVFFASLWQRTIPSDLRNVPIEF